MDVKHPSPFAYEDILESSIQNLIAHNNKFDPTGKLNDLRIPPHRVQQSLRRPKWYSPSLHASTPYLSATIAQTSSTLHPNDPLILTVTLHHHPSSTGNPLSKPVIFQLQDTHLTTIDPIEFHPWLLLHLDANSLEGGLKEIEGDESEGHGPAVQWEDVDESSAERQQQPPLVSLENGFVSLAVGESITLQVDFRPEREFIKAEERYSICFRGVGIKWWRFGLVEEFEAGGPRKDDGEKEEKKPRGSIIVPCSNLVEISGSRRGLIDGG